MIVCLFVLLVLQLSGALHALKERKENTMLLSVIKDKFKVDLRSPWPKPR